MMKYDKSLEECRELARQKKIISFGKDGDGRIFYTVNPKVIKLEKKVSKIKKAKDGGKE
jgi:hypothetical protein